MITKDHEIIFSLIMATYNRELEVECYIKSLLVQNFDITKLELIIIDQNQNDILLNIVNKFKHELNIIHIKSKTLGLSINRNIGIKIAKGDIYAFPDDDCTYHPDTLSTVYQKFLNYPENTTLMGQIIDIDGHKIIRNWPDHVIKLSAYNFFKLYSSITIFTRCKNGYFDTRLGIGSQFGSYEDADYVFTLLQENKRATYYDPTVKVAHPQLNINTMPPEKVISYGLGFGAFCKKNLCMPILILYLQVIAYHSSMFLFELLKLNKTGAKKRYFSIKSRVLGFLQFDVNK